MWGNNSVQWRRKRTVVVRRYPGTRLDHHPILILEVLKMPPHTDPRGTKDAKKPLTLYINVSKADCTQGKEKSM